jgi:pyruvate dehydrogenase E2 component (dihydrolipoamide acetyltransferase)
MPTDVIMPQMGESIFEGTLTKWLKKPGDKVQRDEPLFEISTDKVDAEIPSPSSGVLKEIKVQEGTTVQVNTVVGVIDAEGAGAAAPAPAPAKPEPARPAAPSADRAAPEGVAAPPPSAKPTPPPETRPKQEPAVAAAKEKEIIQFPTAEPEQERVRSSPLVRRMAREYNINLAEVAGTGLGGRITKEDIQAHIPQHAAGAAGAAPAASRAATAAAPQPAPRPAAAAAPQPSPVIPPPVAIPGELVPMTTMRKKIAEHMVLSKRTSAHVHSVFEVDLTRIVRLREREKAGFEQRNGIRLTFMPFFARAVMAGISQFPIVNASVEGDNIRYHRNVNLGIAVALEWGLIVPVVKNAEEKNFLGLQRAIADVAERARSKKLNPDEVQGGTFTITNPGIYGPLFGMPIINQPQVAIMGVGGIFKTPVVKTDPEGNDYIAIGSIVHLSLGYDHRLVDGAIADQFLAVVKKKLENWDEEIG